jgi:hypothetical protein
MLVSLPMSNAETGQVAWADSALWREVWLAVQKILAACLLIAAHKGLEFVLGWANATSLPEAEEVIRIYFYLAFRVITIRLVADAVILFVFAPWPRSGRRSEGAK